LITRKLIQRIIKLIVTILCKVEIVGAENIPEDGSLIIASNHLGRLDAFMAYAVVDRDDVILTPAEKYRKYGFFRWIAKKMDGIWLDRYNADIGALRQVLKRLNRGDVLGIAPEGTRSKTEALIEGKSGAVYLASKAQVPILPAAIIGTEDRIVSANIRKLKRTPVTVFFGEVFDLPSLPRKNRDEALQKNTDEVMCQIAAILPPRYRGVYSDHPRLAEILETMK